MPVLTIGGSLRPPLRPPLRGECALVEDVLQKLLAPRRHGIFVHLGDAEAALPPLVLTTVLFGDNPWGGASHYAHSRMITSEKFMSLRGRLRRHATASYVLAASSAVSNVPRPRCMSPERI
ncbi:hypothetical protein D1007_04138 [Hordeum vulgare]|nr:hypothetical protein D1007_04138 [Hordeum vulgare]